MRSLPLCALLMTGWAGRGASAAAAARALSRLAVPRAQVVRGLAGAPRASFAADASSSGGRGSAAVVQDDVARASSGEDKQPALDLTPPRGTRDFYPAEMRVRNWLFGKWRQVSLGHGFEEYDAPVMESEALYIRKAGEEVTQQLYNFDDKQGRRMALRPEMTPSLARMVLGQRSTLPVPIKWFAIPQCWRYERTTRGRRREHYQYGALPARLVRAPRHGYAAAGFAMLRSAPPNRPMPCLRGCLPPRAPPARPPDGTWTSGACPPCTPRPSSSPPAPPSVGTSG